MFRISSPGRKAIAPWALFLVLAAHAGGAPVLRIPRVARAPRLADFLQGAQREAYATVTDFRQRQPHDGVPATHRTEAHLSYDDKALYVAFVCADDPRLVRAHLSRRENISGDDKVGVSLDTFHDGRRAYMFFANPLGVQLDGITTEGQPDDYQFDTVWHGEGRLTATGYVVLISIPFKSLRSNSTGAAWGIALTRNIQRNQEYSTWPRITDRIEAYVPQFAALEGLEPAHGNHDLQLIPYGFLAARRSPDGSGLSSRTEVRGGFDAKAVLRGSLTFDATVNPDFSQVESDEPQVTVNRRYEVYFPEKRPFFQENSGFFETPEPLFFSRRIADPQFGARLSGKAGPWAIGLLAADDRAPGRSDGSFRRAQAGVARVQRELSRESSAGVTVTSRSYGSDSNQVFSADTRVKLNPNWAFTAQAAASSTRGEASRSGTALFAEARHTGRHLQYAATYTDRSPGFQSELGFISRVDVRQASQYASYRWRPEQGRVLSFGPGLRAVSTWDHSGRLQDWFIEAPFWIQFRGPSSLAVTRVEAYEFYRGRGFRTAGTEFYWSSDVSKRLGWSASLSHGTGVAYYPAAGAAPFAGQSDNLQVEVTWRPAGRFRFDQSWYYTRLASAGTAAFSNHLLRSKAAYQFSRALSLRAILDTNAVVANASLVTVDPVKRVTADVLLTYLINPSTAIYAGWTDNRENLMFDSADGWRRASGALALTGRQFFVKASYLLRF